LTAPRTEAALLLVLGPGLLSALAFKHADCAPGLGIEHRSNLRGLLAATSTGPDWVGFEARKYFVLELVELVAHGWPARRCVTPLSTKVNSCSLAHGQDCQTAWNPKTKLRHCGFQMRPLGVETGQHRERVLAEIGHSPFQTRPLV
jgi:hypothetical protein